MSTYNPLISVIIPYYNSPFNFFQEAIESVLSQSYPNWEAIIIDDGNTKENKCSIKNFVDTISDDRISIINLDKNYGVSTARNVGIKASKGEIITFLDSDDIHLPWNYEQIVEGFKNNPDSLILSSAYLFYLKLGRFKKFCTSEKFWNYTCGKESAQNLLNEIKQGKRHVFPHLCFKRVVFNNLSFDPNLQYQEDIDFLFKILDTGHLVDKLSIVPLLGYIYRMYPATTRLTCKKGLHLKENLVIIHRYKKDEDALPKKLVQKTEEENDFWRFCEPLYKYLYNGSLPSYLRSTFSSFRSNKDKIKSIRALLKVIILNNYLLPLFGINFLYIYILYLNSRLNKFKEMKTKFLNYLNNFSGDGGARYYAERILNKIF